MYSFYPNSTMRWSKHIPELKTPSDIVIGNEGLMFVANLNPVFFYLIGISTINGSIIWEVQAPDALEKPDTIAYGSGLVILGSSCGTRWCNSPRLIAFNVLDGSLKWISDVITNTFEFYYIVSDDKRGVIYCVSFTNTNYNTISAVDGATGNLKWTFNLTNSWGNGVIGEIAITSKGELVFTFMDRFALGRFSKLSLNGEDFWTTAPRPCSSGASSFPTVDQYNDVFYFGCGYNDSLVTAFDSNGELKWKINEDALVYFMQGPAIRKSDGALFVIVPFPSYNGTSFLPTIWAMDINGNTKWKYEINSTSESEESLPIIVGENFLYVIPQEQSEFTIFGIPVPTWN